MDLSQYIGRKFKKRLKDGSLSDWTDEVQNVFPVLLVLRANNSTEIDLHQFSYVNPQINVKGKKNGFVYSWEEIAFQGLS